jgi:hypothetical protein
MLVSLILFVGGAFLAYYILRAHGLSSGVPVQQVWAGLSIGPRAVAVAGFIASAYGLGSVINHLTKRN